MKRSARERHTTTGVARVQMEAEVSTLHPVRRRRTSCTRRPATVRSSPLLRPPARANGAVEPKRHGIIIRVSGVRVPPPASTRQGQIRAVEPKPPDSSSRRSTPTNAYKRPTGWHSLAQTAPARFRCGCPWAGPYPSRAAPDAGPCHAYLPERRWARCRRTRSRLPQSPELHQSRPRLRLRSRNSHPQDAFAQRLSRVASRRRSASSAHRASAWCRSSGASTVISQLSGSKAAGSECARAATM
jgi:hypothetical protein